MMKPRFSASDVAGLIGRNPYKSQNECLLKVISMMPKFKHVVLAVKDTMGARTEREIVAQASPVALRAMYDSVNMAVNATSDKEVEVAIQTFQTAHVKQVVQETLEGKRAPANDALKEVVARIAKGETTAEKELPNLVVRSDVVAQVHAMQEHQVLASEIQKRRGTKLEDKAENNYAVETGKEVTDRNTFTEFECPEYRLIGYLDGMQDGKVVETKNRKRFWTVPPAYDFVQLRCYMFMKGKKDGVLLENFPGRGPRTTAVPWDDSAWEDIHENLCSVSATIAHITEEDAQNLARNVFRSG